MSPLADPTMRFSDRPSFDEDQLENYDASTFDAKANYSPRVRDVGGVAVARDIESLLALTAYHVFKGVFARATEVYGPIDQLLPDGGFQILVEPKFSTKVGSQELGTNAAYISGGQAFLLVQMSSLEAVPIGMNPSILSHEFGHHVFQITFGAADGTCHRKSPELGPTPPGRFAGTETIAGFNEGFADFTAFALQQETSVLSESVPPLDNGVRTIDRRARRYVEFTWRTREILCGDSFYCIGTLWARAVFEMYLATGARADDLAARSAFARTIVASVASIPARLRQYAGWPSASKACDFTEIDDPATLAHAYVESFIAGLPGTMRPSACTELGARFDFNPAGCL